MKKLLKIAKNLHDRSKKIFEQLPTLKKLLEQIDNENLYQGTKIKRYCTRKKNTWKIMW